MSVFKLTGQITHKKMSGKLKISAVGREPSYQEKSVTPTAEEQIVKCDDGYDALKSVTVVGDENFKAENIKNGKTIWGVLGTAVGNPFLITASGYLPVIPNYNALVNIKWNIDVSAKGALYVEQE